MKIRLKTLLVIFPLLIMAEFAKACDACQLNQPKLTRGWTHGAGPQGNFDYVIVFATLAIVLLTLIFSIKYLIRPGERNENHIKKTVLNQNYEGLQGNR